MKKSPLFFSLAAIALSAVSCSTDVVNDGPDSPVNPVSKTTRIHFNVSANSFTRAEDDINSLYVGFYRSNAGSPELLSLVEAVADGDGYTADIEIIPNKEPDIVVAFANISDENLMKGAMSSIPSQVVALLDDGNRFVMSSARYFDTEGKDVFGANFDCNADETVELTLDRLAAKVTTTKASAFNPGKVEMYDDKGEKVELTLSLDSWGISATDQSTYLLRQIGAKTGYDTPFSGWDWNDAAKKNLLWSESVGYKATDFTLSNVNLLKYSEATANFGASQLAHETTRTLGCDADNSKPSVILAGHYTLGSATEAATFYRYASSIFTEESKLIEYICKKVTSIAVGPETVKTSDLKSNLCLSHIEGLPAGCLTVQLKDGADVTTVTTADAKDINRALAEACGAVEMFKDGKCYFKVPVEHHKLADKVVYGLVRNCSYSITINGIEGLGSGVASDDDIVSDQPEITDPDVKYTVKFTVNVKDWNDISQDVTIKK